MTPTIGSDHNAEQVRRLLAPIVSSGTAPGVRVAVASPDGVLFAGAAGHADLAGQREARPEDVFPWFSMTKIATATATVRLAEDGALDLDAPVGDLLDGFRPHPRHGHPSTRQLLTHTAGLRNPVPVRWVRPAGEPEDVARLDRVLRRHGTPRRKVGGRASYSNIGYLLAGRVIEAVTGRTVQDQVTQTVLEPLGIRTAGYAYRTAPHAVGYARLPRAADPVLRRVFPAGVVGDRVGPYLSLAPFLVDGAAYGGLVGTIADAARLAAAHATGPDDVPLVLSQASVEEMRTIRHPGKPFDHGIGWFRPPGAADSTPAYVEHYGTGGGFWNVMRVYPDLRLAVVASASTSARWDFETLFDGLVRLPWS